MEVKLLDYHTMSDMNLNLIGKGAPVTDVAILGGIAMLEDYFAYGYNDLKNRCGCYWIAEKEEYYPNIINPMGQISSALGTATNMGVRPVFKYSEIKDQCEEIDEMNGIIVARTNFEYPDYVIESKTFAKTLDTLAADNALKRTGKLYKIKGENCPEYIHADKKVVFIPNYRSEHKKTKLSNGEYSNTEEGYWVEVNKLCVLVDKENDIALSRNVLLTSDFGIIDYPRKSLEFSDMWIYEFLNNRFINDIQPSNVEKKAVTTITIDENQINELLSNNEVLLNNGNFKLKVEQPKVYKK